MKLIEDKFKTKKAAEFEIDYLQFLDENSHATQAFPAFATDEHLLKLYRNLAFARALDVKTINLQRTGKMGTYPSCRGQEAVGIGAGDAIHDNDVFVPYYRDLPLFLMRRAGAKNYLNYWGGDERGSNYDGEHTLHDFPSCVPIATQCLHAAGVAYAIKYRNEKRAVLTCIGEGGTSEGEFYEALNVAGAWKLPLVFLVNNNQWAISVPRDTQSACKTFAQKAIAGGFEGVQVDGNDVIAVRYAVDRALEKARNGGGPTLIEAVTYRLSDHTTADDATRYQPSEEVKKAWEKEPIARLAHYLEAKKLWSREQEAALQKELVAQVDAVLEDFLNTPAPKPTDMFDSLFAKLPQRQQAQREFLVEETK